MHCYCHPLGPASSNSSCSRELPRTGGCLHSYPAKRVKLRPAVSKSAKRTGNVRRKDLVCLAHSGSQANAAAVAERPTEAPASSIPVQLLTSSRSPELLRIRHSVSFGPTQDSSITARCRHAVCMNHHITPHIRAKFVIWHPQMVDHGIKIKVVIKEAFAALSGTAA